MKKLILILVMVLVAGQAWGATYNIGPGQTYTTFTLLIATETLTSDDIVDGGGNTFREVWTPDGAGTSGNEIVLQNAVILGSDSHLTGWADQGGNVWRKNIGTTSPGIIVFNNNQEGVVDATPDADYEYTYSSPNLDIYAESDPNGYYTSIEVAQRDYGVRLTTDYIKVQNITAKIVNSDVFSVDDQDGIIFDNINGYYTNHAQGDGLTSHGSSTVTVNNATFGYCSRGITHTGTSVTTHENIVIHDCTYGVYSDTGTHTYTKMTIRDSVTNAVRQTGTATQTFIGCKTEDTGGIDVYLAAAGTLNLYNSFLSGSGSYGVYLATAGGTLNIDSCTFLNQGNTSVLVTSGTFTIKNSAFERSSGYTMQIDSGVVYTEDYNYLTTPGYEIRYHSTNYNDVASYRTASSQGAESAFSDPMVSLSGKLESNSPCVNAGEFNVVTQSGYADPWRKHVHRLPNIGADQGAGTPKGGNRILRIGDGGIWLN